MTKHWAYDECSSQPTFGFLSVFTINFVNQTSLPYCKFTSHKNCDEEDFHNIYDIPDLCDIS